ncbi:hypothetical protein CANARDRAFT_30618 [[Candida] arabinofermentans NRRL YB-2248]|uniref:Uncharacterized protein n=1 Tax=[Candida] arabinofermentans NRRL YB-2248 TaxID=983967 RepID=A0A1E4ST64_9ASCO|nr:hypothetical protein CANARDRAFT_30618 [[Candida] arabinofermentans NRRL YB-2248]
MAAIQDPFNERSSYNANESMYDMFYNNLASIHNQFNQFEQASDNLKLILNQSDLSNIGELDEKIFQASHQAQSIKNEFNSLNFDQSDYDKTVKYNELMTKFKYKLDIFIATLRNFKYKLNIKSSDTFRLVEPNDTLDYRIREDSYFNSLMSQLSYPDQQRLESVREMYLVLNKVDLTINDMSSLSSSLVESKATESPFNDTNADYSNIPNPSNAYFNDFNGSNKYENSANTPLNNDPFAIVGEKAPKPFNRKKELIKLWVILVLLIVLYVIVIVVAAVAANGAKSDDDYYYDS